MTAARVVTIRYRQKRTAIDARDRSADAARAEALAQRRFELAVARELSGDCC